MVPVMPDVRFSSSWYDGLALQPIEILEKGAAPFAMPKCTMT
jgi:hypothetical protein